MERLHTIRDACRILQIHPTTMGVWDREGRISCVRMQNNFRRVPESEINRILGIQDKRSSYIYASVSSNWQREDLERRIIHLKSSSPESGVITDIRSGMMFDRKGFLKLLDEIESDRVSSIYITHKDRIARFGYDLVERICEMHGAEIVITDGDEILTAKEELSRDLMSITTSFPARLYGLGSHKTRNILEAVKS